MTVIEGERGCSRRIELQKGVCVDVLSVHAGVAGFCCIAPGPVAVNQLRVARIVVLLSRNRRLG